MTDLNKTDLIAKVQQLQSTAHVKVSATSTLKSKSIAQLQELVTSLVADVQAEIADIEHRDEMGSWTRGQCVQYLRDNGYDGPVSYLMPKLREIAMQWGA